MPFGQVQRTTFTLSIAMPLSIISKAYDKRPDIIAKMTKSAWANQGASLLMIQKLSDKAYEKRSCSLFSLPCQNSK